MHYYIDGYNLIFRLLRASDNLQAQRERILEELSRKIALLNIDATIVFDAHYQPGESSKSHLQSLEIFFTAGGDSADEFIIHELKSVPDPRQETVVTSDKKLAWRARRKAAKSESVEEFVEWLNRRYKNKIRELKEDKCERLVTNQPAPPPAPPPLFQEPLASAKPEECQNYYETMFEKSFHHLCQEEPSTHASSTHSTHAKRRKKKAPLKQEETRSDMERWLEVFEQHSSLPKTSQNDDF